MCVTQRKETYGGPSVSFYAPQKQASKRQQQQMAAQLRLFLQYVTKSIHYK